MDDEFASRSQSEELLRHDLANQVRLHGPDSMHVAVAISNLALLLHATNRLAEAETLMRRAGHRGRF